jgi:Sec-independent protein secretion pathway component TatC
MATGLDEDTMRTVQSGRETAGSLLRAVQGHLQKVFILWVVVLLATIMILQNFLWDQLRRDLLYAKMDLTTAQAAKIIAVTPFDVILLQVKIGAVLGILVALPVLVYLSRDGLRRRDMWPSDRIPRWKLAVLATTAVVLFVAGIVYAYELFFPLMFGFLAENALAADFQPNYSIVMWVQFIVLLGMSFGLAAQMPLMISALSYSGIVPYETFRDRWKWAVMAIFGFGALFSPPDPFTQVMWAAPLVGLYVVSLGLAKLLTLTKRAGEEVETSAVARQRWNKLAAAALILGALVYYLIRSPTFQYIQEAVAFISTSRTVDDVTRPALFGLGTAGTALVIAFLFGIVGATVVLYYYMVRELDVAAAEAGNFGDPSAIDIGPLSAGAVRSAPPEAFAEMDEPTALEHAQEAMEADNPEKAEAILDRWDAATGAGDATATDEAAETDTAAESDEEGNVLMETGAGMLNAFTEEETTEDDIGGYYYDLAFIVDSLTSKAIWFVGTFMLVTSIVFIFLYSGIPGAAGVAVADGGTVIGADGEVVATNVSVLSEGVTVLSGNASGASVAAASKAGSASTGGLTGGNRSILATDALLTTRNGTATTQPSVAIAENDSRLVRNATVVGTNASGSTAPGEPFRRTNATVLVQTEMTVDTTSGIGIIKNSFVANLPPQMQQDVRFITLHPVEHLIFIVKFSTIVGAVATLPLLLYFAWPAMREREFVGGDRDTLLVWGGTVGLTLIAGTLIGFLFIAPTVISWLAFDVLDSGMLISYRVAKFGWLVLLFTVGIGIFIEIPVTMLLFHRGGIVSFQTLQERWRTITLGVFAAGALLSPSGIWTMFLVAVPLTVSFLIGLGLLWLYTLGGRRPPKPTRPAA